MNADKVLDAVLDVLRREALGPSWQRAATAWPLSALGGENSSEDWYGERGRAGMLLRKRSGPTITVWLNRTEWLGTFLCSPTGKNPTIVLRKGTPVLWLDEP